MCEKQIFLKDEMQLAQICKLYLLFKIKAVFRPTRMQCCYYEMTNATRIINLTPKLFPFLFPMETFYKLERSHYYYNNLCFPPN